mmetsp:Transcript_10556/g.19435  ORF Transcript_10556/g.19435 Transcript_10556/m.19435 type:complete len:802 (-) Transcript_10556:40-2445(-)
MRLTILSLSALLWRCWLIAAEPKPSPEERARLLVAKMTLEEKIAFLHGPESCKDADSCFSGKDAYVGMIKGNARLNIPPINMADGPQGFRCLHNAGSSTAFPSGLTMAASWDPDMVHSWGVALGREFHGKGANMLLGPGIEITRTPRGGRNFEYLSGEDPHLGSSLVGQAIRGIQSQKVMANAKHWVLNQQETNRGHKPYVYDGTNGDGYSSEADERTRFEVYYAPFKSAIDAGVGSVMCSYNRILGEWSCKNPLTLQVDLKKRLNFKGFVVSDWGAVHYVSLKEGMDIEMPGAFWLNNAVIKNGITSGIMKEEHVDDSVTRILWAMYSSGIMDEPSTKWASTDPGRNVSDARSIEAARRFSAGTTVLLKNANGVLPLPNSKEQPKLKLALIGFASSNAVLGGSGSGSVIPSSISTPLDAIRSEVGPDASVMYNDGTDIASAAALARTADYSIVFVGTTSSEGADRESLSLDTGCVAAQAIDTGSSHYAAGNHQCEGNADRQNAMIWAVAAANPKTIVVASVPGPVLMPWSPNVSAILTNFMPGQQVGHAIADVLFGKVNPSARLPVTFPNHENELDFEQSQFPGLVNSTDPNLVYYKERLLVGYRYYEAKNIQFTTGFPFGHGLSYTAFEYRNLKTTKWSMSFTVVNTGAVAGAEVAQVYLGFPEGVGEPPWMLRRFKKTPILQPGKSFLIHFDFTHQDFSIWDSDVHDWKLVPGVFKVRVGSSSRDVRLEGHLLDWSPTDYLTRHVPLKVSEMSFIVFFCILALAALASHKCFSGLLLPRCFYSFFKRKDTVGTERLLG